MADDWKACSHCNSRRKACSDADACCVECRITGGFTHTRPVTPEALTGEVDRRG